MIALHVCVMLTVVAPADDETAMDQANNALEAGDMEGGKAALQEALADDPQNVDALWGLGLVSLQQGDPQAASQQFEALLSLDPYNDEARLKLAQAQWLAGDEKNANSTLSALLERHPEGKDALALRAQMSNQTVSAAEPQTWRPVARAGVRTGYDSNMTLANGAVSSATQINAPLASIQVAGGVIHTGKNRPLAAMAYISTQTALSERDVAEQVMPSFVGLSLTGRKELGPALGIIDMRYQELFVDTFSSHIERLLAPSLGASYQVNQAHTLRLLSGVDVRQPQFIDGAKTNVTGRVALRDSMSFGRLAVIADTGLRRNFDTGSSDPVGALTGFGEFFVLGYGQYLILPDFTGFALLNGQFRNFDEGPKESTYGGQLGLRYAFDAVELHGEYGYTQTLSNAFRSYKRHQMSIGVRFWYP